VKAARFLLALPQINGWLADLLFQGGVRPDLFYSPQRLVLALSWP